MKRKSTFLLILLLSFSAINAQVEEYLTVPGAPIGLTVKDNYLYISTFSEGKIQRANLSQSTPTLEELLTLPLFSMPGLIEISESLIYTPVVNGIGTIDLSQTTPTFSLLSNQAPSFGAVVNGNDLYTSRRLGEIWKYDLSLTSPIPGSEITIITQTGTAAVLDNINGIALNGNDLYIARIGANKISKIDITQTNPTLIDVISGVNVWDMLFIGNELYFSGDNSVRKIDVSQINPSIETIVDNLISNVIGIEIHNNYLYMAQLDEDKILRINLNTLSTEDHKNQSLAVYPNPSNFTLNILNANEGERFKILDVTGRILMHGMISNKSININNLLKGVYILKVEGKKAIKILKN